jgi:hypothetical protein
MTTMANIRRQIGALPLGEPFVSRSLLSLGSRASVDQALTRLTKAGVILRVARGVYVRPKVNRFVGKVVPGTREIVAALADARGEKLQAHGVEAVLALGLTTQVPMRSIFYTSGPSRRIQVGRQEVLLKHASSQLLAFGTGPVGLAFAALWYMGKQQVTAEVLKKVRERLTSSEFSELRGSAQLPPWLSVAFQKFEKAEAYG